MINLEFTITEQEYVDLTYYNGWLAPERKSYRVKYFLVNYLIYIGGVLLFFLLDKNFLTRISSIIIFLVFGVALFFYLKFRIKKHYVNYVQKLIRDSGKENVLSPINFTFSDDGVYAKDSQSETKLKWPAFLRKQETKECYYLFLNTAQAFIIPKRVFKNVTEHDEFKSILSRNLSLGAQLPSIG